MGKTPFSLKLDSDLMEVVKLQAKKEHRPVNNFIESVLIKYLDDMSYPDSPDETIHLVKSDVNNQRLSESVRRLNQKMKSALNAEIEKPGD